jgi:hypothetical protein
MEEGEEAAAILFMAWSVRFGVLGLCMEQQQIELEILFFCFSIWKTGSLSCFLRLKRVWKFISKQAGGRLRFYLRTDRETHRLIIAKQFFLAVEL